MKEMLSSIRFLTKIYPECAIYHSLKFIGEVILLSVLIWEFSKLYSFIFRSIPQSLGREIVECRGLWTELR